MNTIETQILFKRFIGINNIFINLIIKIKFLQFEQQKSSAYIVPQIVCFDHNSATDQQNFPYSLFYKSTLII